MLAGLVVASLTSGVIGYSIANARQSEPRVDTLSEPTYGSVADFDAAIKELRASFPSEGVVTTDPDDLYYHGLAVSDYLPGMCCFCLHGLTLLRGSPSYRCDS